MNLFQRYIFLRAFKLTAMSLVAATAIVLITQVLGRVNLLTSSGQALATFGKLALMMIPSMAIIALPFAVLIGAVQVLSQMNSDSELSVVESAGGSPIAIARPVIMLGLLASIVTLVSNNFVEPPANRQIRNIVTQASADLARIAIRSGGFREVDKNLYLQVAEEKPGGQLGGLFIVDMREPTSDLIYYAKTATIFTQGDQSLLLMQDGEIQRRNVASGDVSVIRFDSYAIDFIQFGAAGKAVTYYPKEQDTAQLLFPAADDPFATKAPHLVRSEIHRRFSEWLFPLSFAMIAAYFVGSARSNRQERIWSALAAFTIALTLRGAGFYVSNQAGISNFFAVVTYLVSAVPIVLFGTLIATGRQLAIPQRLIDQVAAIVTRLETWRVALILRLKGYRGEQAGGGA